MSAARRPRVALVAYDLSDHGSVARIMAELVRQARDRVEFVVVSRTLPADLRPHVEWRRVWAPRRPYALRMAVFFFTGAARLARVRADLVHIGQPPLVPNRADVVSVDLCHAGFHEAARGAPGAIPRSRRLRRLVTLPLERRCLGRAAVLLAPSSGVERELARHYPGIRFTVVPYGVDPERFRPDPASRAALREAEGVAAGDVVALLVGRPWHLKGLEVAIEAFATAAAEAPALSRLWVVGKGNPAPFRRLARGLGVEDRVRFFGFRSDVERFYQAADVFVLPTLYETFSLAAHEAAACGLPVVATPVSGIEELVGEDEAGLLVEREAGAVACALARLARDPELRARLGREGRRRCLERSVERSVEQILGVYERLGAGGPT